MESDWHGCDISAGVNIVFSLHNDAVKTFYRWRYTVEIETKVFHNFVRPCRRVWWVKKAYKLT